jgi:hypothetical protein
MRRRSRGRCAQQVLRCSDTVFIVASHRGATEATATPGECLFEVLLEQRLPAELGCGSVVDTNRS